METMLYLKCKTEVQKAIGLRQKHLTGIIHKSNAMPQRTLHWAWAWAVSIL
jgi:hypothetical protein